MMSQFRSNLDSVIHDGTGSARRHLTSPGRAAAFLSLSLVPSLTREPVNKLTKHRQEDYMLSNLVITGYKKFLTAKLIGLG